MVEVALMLLVDWLYPQQLHGLWELSGEQRKSPEGVIKTDSVGHDPCVVFVHHV